tara:strand:- start:12663 stop:13724 length:1062 start_codon:yes stop_codon:yes gene_type:complete
MSPADEQTTLLRPGDGATTSASRRWASPSVFTGVATIATVLVIVHGARQVWTAPQSVGGDEIRHPPTSQPPATLAAKDFQPLMRMRMWGDTNQANQDNCVVGQLSQTCEVTPADEEFCVYVNTNDFYYRFSDGLGASRDTYFFNRVATDPKYQGSMLQRLFSDQFDPEFSGSDPARRIDILQRLIKQTQCEVFGDDTLLIHIRSGDSGWTDKAVLGHGNGKRKTTDGSLGMIDANAIAGIFSYLGETPQIKRVVMRTTLHFGVPEPGDEQNDPSFAEDNANYAMTDTALWGTNFMLRDIYDQLVAHGYETWVTSNADADQDTCEYAKACHFLSPDGRGFSQLIRLLNQNLHTC